MIVRLSPVLHECSTGCNGAAIKLRIGGQSGLGSARHVDECEVGIGNEMVGWFGVGVNIF